MISLFTIDEQNLEAELPSLFEMMEAEIAKAEPLFEIDGERLEKLARDLPKHQAHYSGLRQDMKHLMRWLENWKSKEEAILLKNYQKGQRALTATDTKTLINGEKTIIEANQMIIVASQLYMKLDDIVECFKQMGWMIGNITKLRVAELGDIIV